MTKVDEDYPDNKLSGAVFEVYSDTNGDGKLDKDDTLLGEMKELDGGVYQMSELRYGKYLVKESKAPTGFVLDEDVYAVSIEENGKTYTVENKDVYKRQSLHSPTISRLKVWSFYFAPYQWSSGKSTPSCG